MTTRTSSARLAQLQAVTDAALAHLELDELLAELLDRIRESLDVDDATILLLDHDRNELVVRASAGGNEDVETGMRIPVGTGFAGRIAAEQRPVIVEESSRTMLGVACEPSVSLSRIAAPMLVSTPPATTMNTPKTSRRRAEPSGGRRPDKASRTGSRAAERAGMAAARKQASRPITPANMR